MALAQVEVQAGEPKQARAANLGIVYATAQYGSDFSTLAQLLRERTGIDQWVGAIGHGICASGVEYVDEPALAILLAELPAGSFRLFSGRQPLPGVLQGDRDGGFAAHTALVHADPSTPDLMELVKDMAERIATGYLFGAVVSGELDQPPQLAHEVVAGGLSGALIDDQVRLLSRVTQGCAPLVGEHVISDCSSHYIKSLDGMPALDVMLEDLGVAQTVRQSRDGNEILRALPMERLRRGLLVGLAPTRSDRQVGFGDYLVRNLIGIDPQNRLIAVAARPERGARAVFCTRDQRAARGDLIRICSELRDEVESEQLTVKGGLYFSCVGRGQHLFGSQGAELELIRHNLGDLPLIGMYANGEIAGNQIYGYTGVLTLFV